MDKSLSIYNIIDISELKHEEVSDKFLRNLVDYFSKNNLVPSFSLINKLLNYMNNGKINRKNGGLLLYIFKRWLLSDLRNINYKFKVQFSNSRTNKNIEELKYIVEFHEYIYILQKTSSSIFFKNMYRIINGYLLKINVLYLNQIASTIDNYLINDLSQIVFKYMESYKNIKLYNISKINLDSYTSEYINNTLCLKQICFVIDNYLIRDLSQIVFKYMKNYRIKNKKNILSNIDKYYDSLSNLTSIILEINKMKSYYDMVMFSISYNVMRIMSGQGGLSYSS